MQLATINSPDAQENIRQVIVANGPQGMKILSIVLVINENCDCLKV